MNLLSKLKSVAKIGLVFGVFAAAISGVNLVSNHLSTASAAPYDCKTINVINCGLGGSSLAGQIASLKSRYTNNTTGFSPDYGDVQTIYNSVGANWNLINSMNESNTVSGYVWKDGSVTDASGRLLGNHAMTVGRFNTANSTHINGTNAYIRPTTESFADTTIVIPAIIFLDNDKNMVFGALLECGNAFTATVVPQMKPVAPIVPVSPVTPPKTPAVVTPAVVLNPDYSVVKMVADKKDMIFAPSITVNYGTHVVYRITVTSTGAIPVKSVAVNDVLPNSIKYVIATIKHDGIGTGTTLFEDVSVSDGYRIASLDNGSSTVLTFEAVVGPNDTATSCNSETINNTVTITQKVKQAGVALLTPMSSTATVYKTCNKPPVVPKPTVAAPVVPITPVAPVLTATCTNLTLVASTTNPRLVTGLVTYSASTGVALNNVSFNWNDGYLFNNGVALSAQHTYAANGTYNVVATLSFSSGSTGLPQSTCQKSITINVATSVTPTVVAPTVLPNTGAGSVVALFAGVSTIGTLGYRVFLGRRLTQ